MLLKTADGRIVETGFEDEDFNVYPANETRYPARAMSSTCAIFSTSRKISSSSARTTAHRDMLCDAPNLVPPGHKPSGNSISHQTCRLIARRSRPPSEPKRVQVVYRRRPTSAYRSLGAAQATGRRCWLPCMKASTRPEHETTAIMSLTLPVMAISAEEQRK